MGIPQPLPSKQEPEPSKQAQQVASKLERAQSKRVQMGQSMRARMGQNKRARMGRNKLVPVQRRPGAGKALGHTGPERIGPERVEPERIERERSKADAGRVAGKTGKVDGRLCKSACIYPWVDNVLPTDRWHWGRPAR